VSYRRLALVLPGRTRRLPVSRLAIPLGLLAGALVVVMGVSAIGLPPNDDSAGAMALQAMAQQPIANPVTAVLLLFRGYDTLLELAVLLAAWLGSRLVLGDWVPARRIRPARRCRWWARCFVWWCRWPCWWQATCCTPAAMRPAALSRPARCWPPPACCSRSPGRLVALPEPPAWQRVVLVLGIVVFSAIGLAAMAFGLGVLALPGKWAIYAVETAMLVSIALPLVLLFTASGGLGVRAATGE
jgi:hypothetical protein